MAKPSPIGVDGVIGYAHAACEMCDSTQTTAPEPSVVDRMPGKRGCTRSATWFASNIEALIFSPFIVACVGRSRLGCVVADADFLPFLKRLCCRIVGAPLAGNSRHFGF